MPAILVSLPYCADSNLIFLGITADHYSPFPIPRFRFSNILYKMQI